MIGAQSVDNIWGGVDFSRTPDTQWLSGTREAIRSPFLVGTGAVLGCLSEAVLGASPSDCTFQFQHLSICADAQLHNRQELFSRLGLAKEAYQWNDSRLLIAAFEKWGHECARHLIGEFSFAIWDDRDLRLYCFRDQMGTRPFFYWRSGTKFLFASDVRILLSIPGVQRQLNERKLAGMSVFDGQHYYPEDTFHREIFSIPSGSVLIADAAGIRKQTYWVPEIHPELVPRKPEDAYEALREILFQSVECRLPANSQACAELSGGLDSSSITAIAARCLEKKGRALLAVAGALPIDFDPAKTFQQDERQFIEEFRSWPNVQIEYVTAPGRGPLDRIEEPSHFFATPVRTTRFFLYDALRETAAERGAHSILCGLSGELGPTCWGRRYHLQLAANFRWGKLSSELRMLKAVRGFRPWRFMLGQSIDLFRPFPWKRTEQVFFTRSFEAKGRAWRRRHCFAMDQRKYQLFMIQNLLRMHAAWWAKSIEYPIRTSQPWLDKRVVEFCLAAPPCLKVRNGYQRNLVRVSLDGVLPKNIQWRTSKTFFSPNFAFRFNTQLEKAREFIAAIGPKDPVRAVVDVNRLASMLTPADPQKDTPIERERIPATFYVLCFLRQFPEFRP
jgi:asparagine synthase (glutamine-hydrolysing)